MFVIPVAGDKIKTKDDSSDRVVSSYTSFKDEPAVYVRSSGGSGSSYVYFSDVTQINGVKVEYNSSSKVFNALGPLRRKYNIPQPKDEIIVKLISSKVNDEQQTLPVTSIKLHSKRYGETKGLLVCSTESCFTLNDILGVKRKNWTEKFDADGFQKYYFDYLPTGFKSKS